MFNEVKELYALLNMILLHACLKWQQRQEVKEYSVSPLRKQLNMLYEPLSFHGHVRD